MLARLSNLSDYTFRKSLSSYRFSLENNSCLKTAHIYEKDGIEELYFARFDFLTGLGRHMATIPCRFNSPYAVCRQIVYMVPRHGPTCHNTISSFPNLIGQQRHIEIPP